MARPIYVGTQPAPNRTNHIRVKYVNDRIEFYAIPESGAVAQAIFVSPEEFEQLRAVVHERFPDEVLGRRQLEARVPARQAPPISNSRADGNVSAPSNEVSVVATQRRR